MRPLRAALFGLLTSLAASRPLLDVEHTELSIDSTRETLDAGAIALHLVRIDDLVDDVNGNKLLLEKQTHIGLKIQLDRQAGLLQINGEVVPLLEDGDVNVKMVKAETYALPDDLPAAFYEPESVEAMVSALSRGIVGVEVRVQSQQAPVEAIADRISEDAVAIMPVEGVSMRMLGIFVRITEVEGQEYLHAQTVFTPILQLLAEVGQAPDGRTVKKISTLSIGGQPVSPEGAHSSPADTLPQLYEMLPPITDVDALDSPVESEGADAIDQSFLGQSSEEPQQAWNPHQHHSSGFLGFLKAVFGQPAVTRRPCKHHQAGMRGPRKGLALSGMYRSAEGSTQDGRHHGSHHSRGRCFWRSFVAGFASVFIVTGNWLVSTIPGAMLLGLFVGGLSFKITRAIVRKVRAKRQARFEQLPQYAEDINYAYDEEDEKVMEPPAYQHNEVLFNADVPEDEKAPLQPASPTNEK